MRPCEWHRDREHILYDADCLANVGAEQFDPAWWQARGAVEGSASGRGTTWFVRAGALALVLRHYRRGGLIARLSADRYFWLGLARTRAWAEWGLLARLRALGLPVPRPVAARVIRGGLGYRADILVERLEGCEPLAERLQRGPAGPELWQQVGRCIRRFHDAGVYHHDLNASNILLAPDGQVYLIDFDRGRLRRPGGWRAQNIARLHRSLAKFAARPASFHFDAAGWEALRRGYGG